MIKKKRFIVICLTLSICLVSSALLSVSATSKSAISSDSIRDKQNQIDQAQKEIEQMEDQITDLERIKKELETNKANLKDYVKQLDSNLGEIEQNIVQLQGQITDKEQSIVETEAELSAALTKEENQKDFVNKSIKIMYEKGDTYVTDMLFQAEGLADLLNRAEFLDNIMTYEQQMWEQYINNRQMVELCKQELELEKLMLDRVKANLETERANLEDLIRQKNADIVAYESDINNKEKAIQEYEDAIKEQDAEIEALEAAIAEEKKKLLESSGTPITYDGGQFAFPLASYTRISDDYGMRMHPTLHVEKFHNGVDFAAPKGTPIYAAYDGQVVAATYSATMGNYVMIDHGDDLYTIYMHASVLYVSKGDIVVRGETIAGVGTTGRSTGNHLHFGVRKDGAYVSPWNYLSE